MVSVSVQVHCAVLRRKRWTPGGLTAITGCRYSVDPVMARTTSCSGRRAPSSPWQGTSATVQKGTCDSRESKNLQLLVASSHKCLVLLSQFYYTLLPRRGSLCRRPQKSDVRHPSAIDTFARGIRGRDRLIQRHKLQTKLLKVSLA